MRWEGKLQAHAVGGCQHQIPPYVKQKESEPFSPEGPSHEPGHVAHGSARGQRVTVVRQNAGRPVTLEFQINNAFYF